jgi:hypothetical protein
MITKLGLQQFSLAELVIGGAALATVAVVTLMDLRAGQRRDPSSTELRVASQLSSTQPQPPFDLSRLEATGSIDARPSEPSGPSATARRTPGQVEESPEPPSVNSNVVINSRGAKVAGGECDFRSVKREAVAQWHAQAACTDGGSSWNANVSLKLTALKLIWSSERGTATYVRCATPRTSSASLGETGTPSLIQSLGDWLQGVTKQAFVHE